LRGEARRGSGPRFVVTDAARSEPFVASGPATEGAYGLCPCVDLSTSTSLDAQRFVNDFQFSAGAAPGPYAVEGFDAGTLLVDAIEAAAASGGSVDRSAVGESLRALDTLDGLARRWGFAADAPAGVPMVIGRVTGGRWHEASED
jgi:hypothetical protein